MPSKAPGTNERVPRAPVGNQHRSPVKDRNPWRIRLPQYVLTGADGIERIVAAADVDCLVTTRTARALASLLNQAADNYDAGDVE